MLPASIPNLVYLYKESDHHIAHLLKFLASATSIRTKYNMDRFCDSVIGFQQNNANLIALLRQKDGYYSTLPRNSSNVSLQSRFSL